MLPALLKRSTGMRFGLFSLADSTATLAAWRTHCMLTQECCYTVTWGLDTKALELVVPSDDIIRVDVVH